MTMKMDRRGSDWPPAGWDVNARRLSYRCTTLIQVNSGFIQRTRCLWTLTTSTVRSNKSLQWMCPLRLYLSRQTINICGVTRTPFVRVRVPLHCESLNKSQSKLQMEEVTQRSALWIQIESSGAFCVHVGCVEVCEAVMQWGCPFNLPKVPVWHSVASGIVFIILSVIYFMALVLFLFCRLLCD